MGMLGWIYIINMYMYKESQREKKDNGKAWISGNMTRLKKPQYLNKQSD